jgi:hypothetical protein
VGHVWGGRGGRWSMTWDYGGGRIPVVKGAQTGGGVCDGLIGAFHGSGEGYAKVHILLHLLHLRILVCATFFDFLS